MLTITDYFFCSFSGKEFDSLNRGGASGEGTARGAMAPQ